jgi:hypothetical protein
MKEEQSKASEDCRTPDIVSRFEKILGDHRVSLPPRASRANSLASNGSNTIIYNGHHGIEEDIKPIDIPNTASKRDKVSSLLGWSDVRVHCCNIEDFGAYTFTMLP